MEQLVLLSQIINEFEIASLNFCKEMKGLSCDFSSDYNGEKDIEYLKYHSACIDFSYYKIIFRFTVDNVFSQFNHVLDVFIQFNDFMIPFHICLTHYDIKTLDCFFIPCISNPGIMKSSMQLIMTNITKHLPVLLERYDGCIDKEYREHVCLNMELEEVDEEDHELFLQILSMQEIDQAYVEFLLGHRNQALKLYNKKKNLTTYEYMLRDLLKVKESYNHDLDEQLINNLAKYKSGILKIDIKEFIGFFVSWFILTIPFGVIYTLLYLVFDFMLSRGSFYVLKEDPFFLFLPAFISAIASSYFFRMNIYKFIFKRDYDKYMELDYMVNSPQANRFMYKFLSVVIVLSLIGTFLLSSSQLVFYLDGFVDRLGLFEIVGTYYRYDDIECITYYKTQENGFGEIIDEGTYIIELEDKEIDLYYYYLDEKELEKNLISRLEKMGVEIVYKEHLEW